MTDATLHIVLTGATGFLGGHLVPKLLKNGHHVTCIVRQSSDTTHLPKDVRILRCDLTNECDIYEALKGQDIFIHLAALLFGLEWNDYLEANTMAAQSITRAIKALGTNGPKRVVLISSMAATGPSKGTIGVDDHDNPQPVSAYGWSKLLVERTFLCQCKNIVILRPSIIYGSGDKGLLPLFKGIKHGFAVSPGLSPFPVSCVHATDMADAIMAVMDKETCGIYHVSDGKCYTMEEFCRSAAKAMGINHFCILHLPLPLLALPAKLSTLFFSLLHRLPWLKFKRMPNWNYDKYREAAQAGWVCNIKRLHTEMGYQPRISLEAGLEETIAGYQARGWL
ncbi:MAG: NAD(P)-dependent oxidoreductase [Desulfovibrio sp.]|nr:NAD(P)-dependent oxidoreductase [Desulfovibrio sp.]